MKTIQVKIEGIAPLLQHKFTAATEALLEGKTKKRQGQAKGDNAEDFLYKVGDVICQPAEHIEQAIMKRASNYKIQGRGKKTYKEMIQGSIRVSPEMIPHKIQDWVVDQRTVVIPSTKGRTVRKRPRFDKWVLSFEIVIMNDQMPVEIVKNCLDDAGREGGLGDYRPKYGRFIVTEFEEKKNERNKI